MTNIVYGNDLLQNQHIINFLKKKYKENSIGQLRLYVQVDGKIYEHKIQNEKSKDIQNMVGKMLKKIEKLKKKKVTTTNPTNKTDPNNSVNNQKIEEKKSKELVFGKRMEEVMKRENELMEIPSFLIQVIEQLLMRGLNKENLCDSNSIINVKLNTLIEKIDNGEKYDVKKESPNVLFLLVMYFLKSLPDPMISENNQEIFLSSLDDLHKNILNVGMNEEQFLKMNKLFEKYVSECDRKLLYHISILFQNISKNDFCNKLTTNILSKILSPVFIKKEDNMDTNSMLDEITSFIITNPHIVYKPPICPSPQFRVKFFGNNSPIRSLLYVESLCQVWSLDSSNNIKIWSTNEMKFVKEFGLKLKTPVTYFIYTKNKIWTCSEDSISVLTDSGEVVYTFNSSGYHLCAIQDTVWVSSDYEILIFDTDTLRLSGNIPILDENIHLMKTIGNQVWTATTLNNILVFDYETKSQALRITDAHEFRINDFITCGEHVWSASDDDTIAVWTKKGTLKKRINPHNNSIKCLVVIDDIVWSGTSQNSIKLWNTKNFQLVEKIPSFHEESVQSFLVIKTEESQDHVIWSSGSDGSLNIWTVVRKENRPQQSISYIDEKKKQRPKKDDRKSIILEDFDDDKDKDPKFNTVSNLNSLINNNKKDPLSSSQENVFQQNILNFSQGVSNDKKRNFLSNRGLSVSDIRKKFNHPNKNLN